MKNQITLIGRLTRDPEQRTSSAGKTIAKFCIAVDRQFKKDGQPSADFFECVAWGNQADYVINYGAKGRLIAAAGSHESRKYIDKDGNNREAWEVSVKDASFLDRNESGGQVGQPSRIQQSDNEMEVDPFDID